MTGRSSTAGIAPGLGAVGEVAVGQQHHRGAVGDGDPDGLDGRVEAVAGGLGRDDRHRRLAVAAEHRLEQVGLLGLGRQAGRGTAALDVDDDERQLGHDGQADRLGLERHARARGGGDAEVAGVGRTDRGTHPGDLVLGLERRHAEGLVLRQLVEDVGGRGDRVGAEEHREPGLHATGDEAVGQGEVAGDVAVGAGGHRRRLDLVLDGERLGRLAEVPPGLERREVGVADVGHLREALGQERRGRVGRAAVHPRQQAEREHVLGARGVLAGEAELLDRLDRHAGQVDGVHGVLGEGVAVERVVGVAGLGEVAGGEVVGVDDDRRALVEVTEVGAQGGRVHRDQHVGGVARGEDVVVGEVHLERRDARQRALGGPDLGGEVGEGDEVVAERRRLLGEPVTGQLHAVAGVAREPDDDAVELLDLLVGVGHLLPCFLRVSRVLSQLPTVVAARAESRRSPRDGRLPRTPSARCVIHDTRPNCGQCHHRR